MLRCYLSNGFEIDTTSIQDLISENNQLKIQKTQILGRKKSSECLTPEDFSLRLKNNFIPNIKFIELESFNLLQNVENMKNEDREKLEKIRKCIQSDQKNYSKFQSMVFK